MKRLHGCLCTTVIALWLLAPVGQLHADERDAATERLLPVAAVTADGSTAYIAQTESGKILRLRSGEVGKGADALEPFIETLATHVVDMQVSQVTEELLLICDQPPRLIRQPMRSGQATVVPLPSQPARIALSEPLETSQRVCITLPWANSVWVGVLSTKADMDSSHRRLSFLPKEVLALDEHRFLLADAFAHDLTIFDAKGRSVEGSLKLNGYHVSGLALDSGNARVLVSHQAISPNAHTAVDDIRWGNLIQNNVTSLLLNAADANKRSAADVHYRLGDFGHGSADPAAVVSLGDRFGVALSGTNEVALYDKRTHQAKFVSVGRVPNRLLRLGEDRLLCLHRCDGRIAVINCAEDQPRLELMIGQEWLPTSAAQRGELAFFSGHLSLDGWMSCQSCHVDGYSPGVLVDTMGDGSFDSPKRIPPLANVAATGPWSWHGTQHTLSEQITKTLTSTMHMPDEFPAGTGINRDSVVDDLVEYMSGFAEDPATAPPLPDNDEAKAMVAGGEALFQQHCARCHDPDQHFTTPRSYDVGLNDERGHKLFNPPSLVGLRHRQVFMHDGRFRDLYRVITNHPKPEFKFTQEELMQLKSYLQRL